MSSQREITKSLATVKLDAHISCAYIVEDDDRRKYQAARRKIERVALAADSTDWVQLACTTRTTAGARLGCNPRLTASLLFPTLGVHRHHDEPKLKRNLSERGGASDKREQASRNGW